MRNRVGLGDIELRDLYRVQSRLQERGISVPERPGREDLNDSFQSSFFTRSINDSLELYGRRPHTNEGIEEETKIQGFMSIGARRRSWRLHSSHVSSPNESLDHSIHIQRLAGRRLGRMSFNSETSSNEISSGSNSPRIGRVGEYEQYLQLDRDVTRPVAANVIAVLPRAKFTEANRANFSEDNKQ